MFRKLSAWIYVHLWAMPRMHSTYRKLSLSETFQYIYRTKAWGNNGEPFCSGAGSQGPVAEQYCAFVSKFILDNKVQSVVDLGCGDFAIGKRIIEATGVRYSGVDVVPELIDHHKDSVRDGRTSFHCADITNDPLPAADLCLVRQVLQHLSNDEITKALTNLKQFSRVLVSEDVPIHPIFFNRDKPHGPGVRSLSGVYVERPPFSSNITQIWELPLSDRSVLRTVLLDQTIASDHQNGLKRTPVSLR